MLTELSRLEAIMPDVTCQIGQAIWRLQDLAIRCQHGRYPDEMVERIDLAYCDIESACDRLRAALVARQTGRG